ncbi:type I-E CRISPR-associated protein Cse2/CasB [Streptomyces sp. CC53]|uniref:type I-E CRISPR-associated protein Cse2/CasB n=1 Tax=Streptomyces sp. CC53 TaxID=1906740 RepID=UPI0008DCB106|nr:type I-E CRISPR-associated protein Cse2/CasB [Streptomyces sp. CC53]OII63375.1 type I-E CRISPR-associated protein Cse2/CasB [Streptomyces sp. CC53]
MTTTIGKAGDSRRAYFWEEAVSDWHAHARENRPGFSEHITRKLRGLRDGISGEPGTVPAMRDAHRVRLTDAALESDRLPDSYIAEHAALALFGRHQQAAAEPAHRPGTGLGRACRELRLADTLADSAVERRLMAAAGAQDLHDLVQHLYRLVPLLRQAGIGLDYTRLLCDLTRWEGPGRDRVLRAWGLQYTEPAAARNGIEAAPYWVRFTPDQADNGAQLAALRSGTGREAGTVPAMWPYYRPRMPESLRDTGALTRDLIAEHVTLTLFGLHQQGQRRQMHIPGTSPGIAARLLLAKNGSGAEALERRFGALLTSIDTGELAMHLRGFVTLLARAGIGLDYDQVRTALRTWDDPKQPDVQSRLRNGWDRGFRVEPKPNKS